MRSFIASCVVVLTIVGGTYTAQVKSTFQGSGARPDPRARPMQGSPLVASADNRLFAIAADERQIVWTPAAIPAAWQVFDSGGPPFGRLAGLAIQGDGLFVTDRADEAVFRVDLNTHARNQLYEEGPIRDPGSIAVARDIFVVDDSSGKLYRLRGRSDPQEVPLGSDNIKA